MPLCAWRAQLAQILTSLPFVSPEGEDVTLAVWLSRILRRWLFRPLVWVFLLALARACPQEHQPVRHPHLGIFTSIAVVATAAMAARTVRVIFQKLYGRSPWTSPMRALAVKL